MSKKIFMSVPRVPWHEKDTGTKVHEDSRTQRERERGQAERAAIERELEEDGEAK